MCGCCLRFLVSRWNFITWKLVVLGERRANGSRVGRIIRKGMPPFTVVRFFHFSFRSVVCVSYVPNSLNYSKAMRSCRACLHRRLLLSTSS